ncbi:MAG: class I SAM-dependent methyltransferase [Deltaproteobacteria bacterium]|nr:class I SAM-dependent methyltransferase [Deltaproteobacteria bacterium]
MAKTEPFENHPDKYEDWFTRNKCTFESELKAIKTLLPDGQGLEIGVGSGIFSSPLGIKKGIEPAANMRKIAQGRGITVVGAVAEAIPFADSHFDFALMVTTICFLDSLEAALKETYRIIKPNGSLIVGLVDRNSPLGKSYLKHRDESLFYKIATFYSTDDVVSNMKKAGFCEFSFAQTIFHSLHDIKEVEPVNQGYGKGSFVVIKAMKQAI